MTIPSIPTFRLLFVGLLTLFLSSGVGCQPPDPNAPSPLGMLESPIIQGKADLSNPSIGALVVQRRQSFCTGTLITSQLVVTAAHCVEAVSQYGVRNVQFRADFSDPNQKYRPEYHEILQVAKHPRYTRGSGASYDIAIIILKNKVTNLTPVPINRSPMKQSWIGQNVKVVGYGLIQTRPSFISADQKYAADIPLFQISPRSFTHYDQKTGKSACHGDSGGPALYQVNGKLRVMGVTSVAYRATSAGNGRTYCDGGAISTRIDASMDFLRPYLVRYGDGPEPCTADAECSPCGTCNAKQVCEPKPINTETKTCQPCRTDIDCGKGGVCYRFDTGYRCLQACTVSGCCPTGSFCASQGSGLLAKRFCVPRTGTCADVSCKVDTECGPGEICKQGTCTLNPPQPSANLCRSCYSSQQCGKDNFCYGGSNPNGYCVQACGDGGFCPEGLRCEQIAPGVRQCIPNGACVAKCSVTNPCPTGAICVEGTCKKPTGGKEGDFCSQSNPCQVGLRCLSGRCAKACGSAPGAPGGPCRADRTCDQGARCIDFGGGQRICLSTCSGSCSNGRGQCRRLSRSLAACICRSDRECGAGNYCNFGAFPWFGACAPKPAIPIDKQCRPGYSCRTVSGAGSFCLPSVGEAPVGAACTQHTRCKKGTNCLQFTQESAPACIENCSQTQKCSLGGRCIQTGRTSRYCFCFNATDCGSGRTCQALFESQGRTYGVCKDIATTKCNNDDSCPQEFSCKDGQCVFDEAKKRKPFPEWTPPEPPEEEPTPEPTPQDASPEVSPAPEPIPETAPESKPEPKPEPKPEATPEPKPEMAPEPPKEPASDTDSQGDAVVGGGCSCQTQQDAPLPSMLLFLLGWLGLFGFRTRHQTKP